MKKSTVALAALSLSLVANSTMAQSAMKICHENEDSYPWIFKDRAGLTTSLLKMAEKVYGAKVDVVALPWKRCLDDARSGAIDGVVKISYAADRTDFLVYPMAGGAPDASKRLLNDSYSLFRMKGSTAAAWDGKALKVDGAVGAQTGFSVVKQLQTLGARVDDGTRSADANLTKLVGGRVAAVALQSEEGEISVTSNPEFNGKVERVSPVLVEKPYFVAFSKQYYGKEEASAKKLWDAIATARESAEYKDLVKKFK
nr:transporter substrate-binding domain-containing protein [uncultured Rhodoferax sp.]